MDCKLLFGQTRARMPYSPAGIPSRPRRCCRSRASAGATTSPFSKFMNAFWKDRGIVNAKDRDMLLEIGLVNKQHPEKDHWHEDSQGYKSKLPGPDVMWTLETRKREVQIELKKQIIEVMTLTNRLWNLHCLLCGPEDTARGIDLSSMVGREPELLTAPIQDMQQRLLHMRIASPGTDIIDLVQREPSLLIEGPLAWDNVLVNDERGSSSSSEIRMHWEHGVPLEEAWKARMVQLKAYRVTHGDALVGSRSSDDASLSRWVGLQRERAALGAMSPLEMEELSGVEFEFDKERAEWLGWWRQLQAASVGLHGKDQTCTAPDAFLLTNWMSVQRVGRRCGVLKDWQIDKLDAIGFDWDAPDPLS